MDGFIHFFFYSVTLCSVLPRDIGADKFSWMPEAVGQEVTKKSRRMV